MLNWLNRLLQSNYVRLLEEEVARERAQSERLRAENRALMNSLLGTAGFPPVEFPEAPKPQPLPRLRKRSWHQLQAWREADAARDVQDHVGQGYVAQGLPAGQAGASPAAFSDELAERQENTRVAHVPRYSNARTNGPVSHS